MRRKVGSTVRLRKQVDAFQFAAGEKWVDEHRATGRYTLQELTLTVMAGATLICPFTDGCKRALTRWAVELERDRHAQILRQAG